MTAWNFIALLKAPLSKVLAGLTLLSGMRGSELGNNPKLPIRGIYLLNTFSKRKIQDFFQLE